MFNVKVGNDYKVVSKVKFDYDKDSGSYSLIVSVCGSHKEICICKYMGCYNIWLDDDKICDYIDSVSECKEKVYKMIDIFGWIVIK